MLDIRCVARKTMWLAYEYASNPSILCSFGVIVEDVFRKPHGIRVSEVASVKICSEVYGERC